jgi:ribosome-associated protein
MTVEKNKRPMTSRNLALKAAHLAEDMKAHEVIVLDLRKVSNVADFFVVCTGDTDTHVRAIATNVVKKLGEQDVRPYQKEGLEWGIWALLDYSSVIVHVMDRENRQYYQIERIWGDADVIYTGEPEE